MGVDHAVLSFFNRPGFAPLDAVMVVLSANWFGLLLAGLAALAIAKWGRFRWRASLALIAAVAVADAGSARLIKPAVARVRPCNERPPQSNAFAGCGRGQSFPSSHATNVAAAALVAGWALPPAWPIAAALAFLIGLSRLYLGVHWPSDVLCGWLLGLLIGGLAIALLRRFGAPAPHGGLLAGSRKPEA